MKALIQIPLLFFFLYFGAAHPTMAQTEEEVIDAAKNAIEAGSSRELTKYFYTRVELGVNENKASYGKSQAEFVVREFFAKNPPKSFEYIHKGASKEGLRYLIGKYTSKEGNTYRAYILIKEYEGSYFIDTLDFSKE
jgi:hypothetical protein